MVFDEKGIKLKDQAYPWIDIKRVEFLKETGGDGEVDAIVIYFTNGKTKEIEFYLNRTPDLEDLAMQLKGLESPFRN